MFQIDDESRFAKKVDFLLPFQQPREEVLHVWSHLVRQNPAKAFKALRLGALAFNNGQESGLFRKDEFSGDYVTAVPGAGWLGKHLFGTNASFNARLRDLLFVGQGAYGVGVIPSPGGPHWSVASRLYFNKRPEEWKRLQDDFPWLHNLLFPYAPTGKLLRNEPNRLWMAMAGATPPWEFAAAWGQEQELLKWSREIALQLRYEHLKANPVDLEWWPTDDEVMAATQAFFKTWAFMGAVFPASSYPTLPGRAEADIAQKAYQMTYGDDWYLKLVTDQPALAAFFKAGTKYVGPEDYKHWTQQDEDYASQRVMRYREQRSWQDLKKQMSEEAGRAKAHAERRAALANPTPLLREQALIEWRKRHPALAADYRDDYFRDQELHRILTTYPAVLRDDAINRWRQDYDVTNREFQRLRSTVRREFTVNPWREARYPEDVVDAVKASRRTGLGEAAAVALLTPAEQATYWSQKRAELVYYKGDEDPAAVMDAYNRFGAFRNAVFGAHPELSGSGEQSKFEAYVDAWRGNYAEQIEATYAEASSVGAAMDDAAKRRDWTTYYALKDKRTALFDMVRQLKNQQYKDLPDSDEWEKEVRSVFAFVGPNVTSAQFAELMSKLADMNVPFVASNEELRYLSMSTDVRSAYVDDLIGRLQTPSGEQGKLFWEWLTDFQQDLLTRNLPADMVTDFRSDTVAAADAAREASRAGGGGAGGELGFAQAMFAQYNQRGDRKAPAGYKAYLDLPNNPAVRADFLKSHPEVGEWIRLGPMANMPEVIRYIVSNIMVKNGRWEGELRTIEEITDLAFAREQMARWTRRPEGARAPDVYDLWLNMPSGVEKAMYFRAHPEIADWLKLGPMSNMPDDYKEVVRDIMLRYGEWTERQDPLGQTITAYYATPGYAKDQFLASHPELLEYWSALRSPEENRMFGLSDQYFAINESSARKSFLASHPDLQDWFVQQRSKRYERFLNKVAQFMGANPELFMQYLERQEDILAELLRNFAEPNLVREVMRLGEDTTKGKTEGGRRRKAG